jgi:hypothetical protein
MLDLRDLQEKKVEHVCQAEAAEGGSRSVQEQRQQASTRLKEHLKGPVSPAQFSGKLSLKVALHFLKTAPDHGARRQLF